MAVDGDSLAHRAYHGLPKTISRAGGRPAGALVGFSNFLMRLWDVEQPRAVVVGWDTLESPTYRHEALPGYQAGRVFDDALLEQLAMLPELVEAFGFRAARAAGFEADDFLGAAAASEEKRRGTCVVVTSDRDAFQLASARTTILRPVKGVFELDRVDPARVVELYGVEPEQVPDFIALRGDPSDGLPGAKGIGPKTASDLLKRKGNLEHAILGAIREKPSVRRALIEQADELRSFKDIATLRTIPIERPPDAPSDFAGGIPVARKYGMNRLAGRLEELAQAR
jgi:DNA polymerase-1